MSHLDNLPFDREIAVKINQHVDNVIRWAEERNIIKGSTPQAQFLKLVEEAGELDSAKTLDTLVDALGDSLVVSIILSNQMGVNVLPLLFDAAREDTPGYHADFEARPYTHLNAQYETGILEALGRVASTVARKNTEGFSEAIYVLMSACVTRYWDEVYSMTDHTDYDGPKGVENALAHAWNEIKDRKGVMLDGVFIKSTDERYAAALLTHALQNGASLS